MDIYVATKTLKLIVEKLGKNSDQLGYAAWKYSNTRSTEKVKVDLDQLDLENLGIFHSVMKAEGEEETRKVTKLYNALKDVGNKHVTSLAEFPKFFGQYLKENGYPLLHSLNADLRGVAYLPIDARFIPAERHNTEPYVIVRFAYNTKMKYQEMSINLSARHIRASIPQILRENNLMVPDESMLEDYAKIMERFENYGGMQGEQFWVKGQAPEVGRSDYWWASADTVNLTYMDKPTKAVLDLDGLDDDDNSPRYRQSNIARNYVHSDLADTKSFVPTHPVLPMFSFAHHTLVWVNVCNMRKYKYEEGLRDKLVLPQSHVRLIGALVSNLDALRAENEAEDRSRTIRAKASSSIILAKGPAGTGKTLTAEVYAEEIKRPLYEVQSGQIGTEPEEIEKNMRIVLNRSIRLKMPLLINEADVFIQSRGRDLAQNAVVSVFLRLLEYHNGLVFLTTNRADDIDDAILSRCIAEIKYGVPGDKERLKLWEIMLAEFNVTLSTGDLRRVVLSFPKVVGRDIQNLIRLTNRVCTAVGEEFSLQVLRDNAVFKGIEVIPEKEVDAEIERRKSK